MNKEDPIKMAREAGFSEAWLTAGENPPHFEAPAVIIKRFAALVAAAEREACAKIVDDSEDGITFIGDRYVTVAAAIRARGNT